MTQEEYKLQINEAVEELRNIYRTNPHVFLTEEDVRCFLYHLLLVRLNHFFIRHTDGSLSSPLHSEVRWYGKEGDKNKRSDIVVMDPSDLRVTADGFELPTKGYGFNHFYGVIEIKLRRVNSRKSDDIWLEEINRDIETLNFLRTGIDNRYDPLLISIVFDKKANISSKVLPLSSDIRVIYESTKSL